MEDAWTTTAAAQARRALFPRGLVQPAGGFRFGADTLLLSAFAARLLPAGRRRAAKPLAGLDLGTGCGAASLGLLLLRPDINLVFTGLDSGLEMVDAATQNARALGLAGRYRAELADVGGFRPAGSGAAFDLALANPPFRTIGTGRTCAEEARNRARFEGPGGFAAFAACAARALRPRGRLFLVHLSERLPELLRVLEDAGLAPRRALPVQGRLGQAPRLVLLECLRPEPGQGLGPGPGQGPKHVQCRGRPGFSLLAPLVLYAQDGGLTPEAAEFCPPLATNPRRAGVETGSALAKANDAE